MISLIDEWKAEIDTLTEDANFVRRQMFFVDDPHTLKRGEQLLKEIETKKQAKQKKYRVSISGFILLWVLLAQGYLSVLVIYYEDK